MWSKVFYYAIDRPLYYLVAVPLGYFTWCCMQLLEGLIWVFVHPRDAWNFIKESLGLIP